MSKLLTLILVVTGLALATIGLNTALGGMTTLGWQFPQNVLTITDAETFARHDSNARFFAGVFVALGIVMALSPLLMDRLRGIVIAFLMAIALGGLFRLLQAGYWVAGDAALLPSLIAEILLAPLLALWVARSNP